MPSQLVLALAVVLRCRASERRFRRHHHANARHQRKAADHADAMAAELLHRAALCVRCGGSPVPSAPRTGSGVPAMPLPSQQAAVPCVAAAVVPDRGGIPSCPEEGARPASIAARGGLHLF